MARISIDNQISEVGSDSARKIGEVLQDAISSLPPNRIVTKILLDGRPIPQNIKAHLLDQTYGRERALEISTVDKEIWSVNGLDIALSCLEKVQRSLIRVAEMFCEENAEANQFFVTCIEGLERFYESVMITRVALKLDFNQIISDGIALARIEKDFSDVLKTIISYQEKRDFIGLADKVEYELLTNLCAWTKALKQLRMSQLSNA